MRSSNKLGPKAGGVVDCFFYFVLTEGEGLFGLVVVVNIPGIDCEERQTHRRVFKIMLDKLVGIDELDRTIGEVNVNKGVLAGGGVKARPLVESSQDIGAEGVVV